MPGWASRLTVVKWLFSVPQQAWSYPNFNRAKLHIIPHMGNYYTLNNCNLAVAHRPSCLRPGAALADKADPHVLAAK